MRKIYNALMFALTLLLVGGAAQAAPTPLSTDLSALATSSKTDILTAAGSYMSTIFGVLVVFIGVSVLWRYLKRAKSG